MKTIKLILILILSFAFLPTTALAEKPKEIGYANLCLVSPSQVISDFAKAEKLFALTNYEIKLIPDNNFDRYFVLTKNELKNKNNAVGYTEIKFSFVIHKDDNRWQTNRDFKLRS